MGPGRAAEIIREGLYRGADGGFLLTDRAFAGADTLATSYALATAIKKINDYDIIIGGRQAIDGDTAQVGPQVAEKLGLTQITYAEEILNVDKEAGRITVKRHIDGGRDRGRSASYRYHRERLRRSLPSPQRGWYKSTNTPWVNRNGPCNPPVTRTVRRLFATRNCTRPARIWIFKNGA